ncbi:MAG: DinB family protein [Chloroflexi bacterium]|nr:DinB family protein [Chloroflexota bacterium]
MSLQMIKTFIEYHLDMTRRVWELIDRITDEQFLADDVYSRGSIRNLMVHLASTDRRWLSGLKNGPDVGHLKFEDYPTRIAARDLFDAVAKDFFNYINEATEEELNQKPPEFTHPRWAVLLHLVNHGTDHRSTVLQKLTELGAPTFDQDYIIWLWSRK